MMFNEWKRAHRFDSFVSLKKETHYQDAGAVRQKVLTFKNQVT
jgi:hypothetical protein